LEAPKAIEVEASRTNESERSSKFKQSVQLNAVTSVAVIVAAFAIVKALLANVSVGSVAPASKVQVIPDPDPKVVLPISVVSRLRVMVSVAEVTVSIPLVPPTILAVLPEDMVWEEPESPAKVQLT